MEQIGVKMQKKAEEGEEKFIKAKKIWNSFRLGEIIKIKEKKDGREGSCYKFEINDNIGEIVSLSIYSMTIISNGIKITINFPDFLTGKIRIARKK